MALDQNYYALPREELFQSLGVSEGGLTDAEAQRRLKESGGNRLTAKQGVSALSLFLSQFKNSLILILLGATGLIFFVWYFGGREKSDLVEGSLILTIILLITLLGFFQEWKAERAIDALKKLLAFQAEVVRGGSEKVIAVEELVPGDVVVLEEGAKVPADIRLIEVATLSANEASLTGESGSVSKVAEAMPPGKSLQLADQKNMVFSGTIIATGRGKGVVVATGDKTAIGQIAKEVAATPEEKTPIQKRLDQVGKTLSLSVVVIAVLVFLFIFFFADEFIGEPWLSRLLHSFVAAIALAVAAIPEGLPAVVTISLALGTQRMLKKKSLVRKLAAVETLGSTDTICADKTGTLTKGEMTVRKIYFDGKLYEVTGTGYEPNGDILMDGKKVDPAPLTFILKDGLVCNNARLSQDTHKVLGDPTEAALLVSAAKANVQAATKRLDEVPFSSERKMMSVVVEESGRKTVYTKGAPEIVLAHCRQILVGTKPVALTDAKKKDILDQTQAMSKDALRVLGFAYRKDTTTTSDVEKDLVFLGLQGMIDPPREEVKSLIGQCGEAGIRVIMITGDHAATAAAVAAEIGLTGETVTGAELDSLSERKFDTLVKEVNIYARVNPDFKMRIIESLKRDNHIVAMTGDGVNDAPALKRADIGIAMGLTGTDVAKEASDMVLLDDHFATIVAAIEEGRGIFQNIKKFVNYLLSCNIGEVFVVFFGILLFQDVLLTATMLLWINVITDGLPAVALGLDPAEAGVLKDSPRKFQGAIIDRPLVLEMVGFAILLTIGVLGIYVVNRGEGMAEARAAVFMGLVLLELVRLITIRSQYRTLFFSNGWLLLAVAVSVLLQLLIIYLPVFANLFGLVAIDFTDWLMIIVVGAFLWLIFNAWQKTRRPMLGLPMGSSSGTVEVSKTNK